MLQFCGVKDLGYAELVSTWISMQDLFTSPIYCVCTYLTYIPVDHNSL